jgi:hypothetical protein
MSQRDEPRLALNNTTAGVREREDANRTRVAGHLDEIQGAVTNTLNLFPDGAVGFIVWLGLLQLINMMAGVKFWRHVSYHYEGLVRKSGRNMLHT